MYLFHEEKERSYFCGVTKVAKNTEKGRENPLPFSIQSLPPLTTK